MLIIALHQKTHWHDCIPFVMLKGLCKEFIFWKDLAKFVCNFKEPNSFCLKENPTNCIKIFITQQTGNFYSGKCCNNCCVSTLPNGII